MSGQLKAIAEAYGLPEMYHEGSYRLMFSPTIYLYAFRGKLFVYDHDIYSGLGPKHSSTEAEELLMQPKPWPTNKTKFMRDHPVGIMQQIFRYNQSARNDGLFVRMTLVDTTVYAMFPHRRMFRICGTTGTNSRTIEKAFADRRKKAARQTPRTAVVDGDLTALPLDVMLASEMKIHHVHVQGHPIINLLLRDLKL